MLSQNLKYLVPVSVLSDERNDLIGEKCERALGVGVGVGAGAHDVPVVKVPFEQSGPVAGHELCAYSWRWVRYGTE